MTKSLSELIASRRAVLGALAGVPLLSLPKAYAAERDDISRFASVAATNADTVTVPPGYSWRPLIAWGDALFDTAPAPFDPDTLTRAEQEQRFGQNNDMVAVFPGDYSFPADAATASMLMCVNHEYFDPALNYPAITNPRDLTPAHSETALSGCGVSVIALQRDSADWRVVRDSAPGAGRNRRITPFSPIVFSGPAARHPWIESAAAFVNARETGPSEPQTVRCGTAANCAGGRTPWGTYLSAEENFNALFGASDDDADALRAANEEFAFVLDCANFSAPSNAIAPNLMPAQFDMSQNPHGPALYGWTVEIDPYDPSWTPRKRTALGRRKAECATTALTREGRVAVYSGDDQINEFLYKFISHGRFDPNDRVANRDLLDEGQLYVARLEDNGRGAWLPITLHAANAAARRVGYRARFRDEGDLMMRAREAARLLGATPMDRPEDVEALLDDRWLGLGPVLIACTNNREQGFPHPGAPRRESPQPDRAQANAAGHILRLDEDDNDCGALSFSWEVFVMCGDPHADALTARNRDGVLAHVSTRCDGAETFYGERFACPDNLCVDSRHALWIATDGSDAVFGDCNDSVLVAPAMARGPRDVKRFLVGPVGAEICGPTMALDERAFFVSIQHPGESDVTGAPISELRWTRGEAPPSTFPDGGGAWPRSAIVMVMKDDGGRIGG